MDPLVLSEPEQFKALGHPLRHRLLMALRQRPATFAQLASALQAAKGTVAYHVKVLQDAGLVRPAHSRRVRGGTEQYFEPSSAQLRIAGDAPVGGEFLVKAALGEMLEPNETILHHVRMTPERAEAVVRELEALAGELSADGSDRDGQNARDAVPYGVLVSVYRADIPVLPAE